jgi:hypothetical protein
VNVSQSDVTSAYVRTASSSRYTYAVWSEGGRIVFRRKLVDSPDFERWAYLSPVRLYECHSTYPDIATSGSYVYVAWEERCGVNSFGDILLATSSNYGATFGPAVNITTTQYDQEYAPRLAASGTYLYLLWGSYSDGLHLAHSKDYGETFTDEGLGFANNDGWNATLDIKTNGSKVYLLYYDAIEWVEDGKAKTLNFVQYYRGSYTSSGEYSSRQRTFEGDPSVRAEGYARLAISGSNVYAAYQIELYNDTENSWDRQQNILWISRDGGYTFYNRKELLSTPANAKEDALLIEMTAAGDQLYLAWDYLPPGGDAQTPYELYLGVSNDAGGTINKTLVATNEGVRQLMLAGTQTEVVFAWSEERGYFDQGGVRYFNTEVFVIRSQNGGQSFSSPVNISQNPLDSLTPVVAIAASGFDLFWVDNSPGNWEVLYKHGYGGDPDIELLSFEVIQAADRPTQLAAGKPTRFRARIVNHYAQTQVIEARIYVRDGEGGRILTEDVHLKPGLNELFLPQFKGVIETFLRPVGIALDYSLVLEAGPGETNLANNSLPLAFLPIVDTRPLRILYVLLNTSVTPAPTCPEITELLNDSQAYTEGIYPIDDSESSFGTNCIPWTFSDPLTRTVGAGSSAEIKIRDEVFQGLANLRLAGGYDKVVGVAGKNFFKSLGIKAIGLAPMGGASSIVQEDVGRDVAAHEIGHNFNLVPSTLPGWDGDAHYAEGKLSPGYDVVRNQRHLTDEDFMIKTSGLELWISANSFDFLINASLLAPVTTTLVSGAKRSTWMAP